MFNSRKNGTEVPDNKAAAGSDKGLLPAITLPKGGGAIRGIGEKFSVNAVNGTASISVPIAVTPGRSGFGPQLSLIYNSGTGNGPFGLGWNLPIPSITRKTGKGLPRYQDAEDSDTFILSDAEDLVPCLKDNGDRRVQEAAGQDRPAYLVKRYRPRVEGLFARIERWTDKQTGDTHWRSISRDNITTIYGRTPSCRLADPGDESRVFSWLIEESRDDRGNVITYEYKQENRENIDGSLLCEKNRLAGNTLFANRYIKRIKYGNKEPRQRDSWLFQVVFDYGDHDPDSPGIDPDRTWACRRDAFSAYRAGFEVRTFRLCQRVLMFHHFAELGDSPCLVQSTDFDYVCSPALTLLNSVTEAGYVRKENGLYYRKELPPLEFSYTGLQVNEKICSIDPDSLENLPAGLDGINYQWLDLDGEGISGILTEQAGAWFYKNNLGNGRFAPTQVVDPQPSQAGVSGGRHQFMDLAGDGHKYLVQFNPPLPGYYERPAAGGWDLFTPFESFPNISLNDPNLKFIDLTGNGFADILISEDDVFVWYPSLARQGFGPSETVPGPDEEEQGPALVFADPSQSIHLADMSGDGLVDIVRIRNGEVCYWPNLGYGRFGNKVTMDGAPRFDYPDRFDPGRIRLADVDGSSPTDVIYLGTDKVTIWFNQAGNSWSAPYFLHNFPAADNLAAVNVVDLTGNGTACLVWSSPLPGDAGRPLRYTDLTGGIKPYLLQSARNNLGAETRVQYAASTRFFLEDRAAGRPWVTKLPFPVHVVERVEACDRIGQNRFVTRYAYHHGYYDGAEREFRGFGLVEQWDAEEYLTLREDGSPPPAGNSDEAPQMPPVYTKTWFHTGAYLDGARISGQFASEYYREPNLTEEQFKAMLLDDTVLPAGLTAGEEREACRALKGSILRQEVYGLDSTVKSAYPYSVSERNYTVELLQPRAGNPHAVFFVHPRETVDYRYERETVKLGNSDPGSPEAADPRVSHQVILKVDGYGNVERSAAIAYPRREIPGRLPAQAETHITFTVDRFANYPDQPDWYYAGLPVETRTYEIVNPPQPGITAAATELFTFEEMRTLAGELFPLDTTGPAATKTWPYEKWDWRKGGDAPAESRLRLVEHVRTLYYKDDLTAPLPLGQAGSPALVFETYKLAFTPELLAAYRREQEELLPGLTSVLRRGGYILSDDYKTAGWFPAGDTGGHWWVPSGRKYYSPLPGPAPELIVQNTAYAAEHFYLPQAARDPFGAITRIEYDRYAMLPKKVTDPLGNIVTVETKDLNGCDIIANDYRVMQPWLVTDPNGNRTGAAFDALGLVTGTAVMGKVGENKGDSLAGFKADLEQSEIEAFFADPKGPAAAALLGGATTRIIYDVTRYARLHDPDRPVFAAALARETHAADPLPPDGLKIRSEFSYSDGFGREIQKKIQAEAGPAGDGRTAVNPRWVGSGWTIFNNKGRPVKQYEPFFTATHEFEFARRQGVSSTLFYDPLERVVATLHPDHTYEKVVFNPWRQETWDANDTILINDPKTDPHVGGFFRLLPDGDYLPAWYESRKNGRRGAAGLSAAQKTAAHANTPKVAHFDTLGRPFLTIVDNGKAGDGSEQKYEICVELDLEGNQRAVIDSGKREVMRYDYNMLGREIKQVSMDAGIRWLLEDVAEKPVRMWDSRSHEFIYKYDALQRPLETRVNGGDGTAPLANLYEKFVYGEGRSLNGKTDRELNLRGRLFKHYDTAGMIRLEEYDFKGNPLKSSRRLAKDYKQVVQWDAADPDSLLENETFGTEAGYDALNRVTRSVTPDGSVIKPAYNEAGLLEKVRVEQAGTETCFVTGINYNEKGQRRDISCGSGVSTTYEYDRETFRLIRLRTNKAGGELLQDLSYTYDPVGNIVRIEDRARPAVFFGNFETAPVNEFTYDALYRLIETAGREHVTRADFGGEDNWNDLPFLKKYSVNDPMAWRNYTQQYQYDAVGNIKQIKHIAGGGGWTRDYAYETANNRLQSTTIGSNTYSCPHHPRHGFMEAMPHLQVMKWNFKDELQAVARQRRTDGGTPETTCYVYDASGRRVRKVTEHAAGPGSVPLKKNERIYVGGIEIYREYTGMCAGLERKTLHIMDDASRIAMVETRNEVEDGSPAKLVRYQLSNHLGTACLETDDNARVISCEEYHPYGTTSCQAVDRSIKAAAKRYRYTGKERDEETGLYYHGARYYAPWLGRWISCDPAGMADGTNLYAYTAGNPVRFIDPKGTQMTEAEAEKYVQELVKRKPYLKLHPKDAPVPGPRSTLDLVTSGENFERVASAALTIRAAQVVTEISLGLFGGALAAPALEAMAAASIYARIGLAGLGFFFSFESGFLAGQAISGMSLELKGTTILTRDLSAGERWEAGAYGFTGLLFFGFGYAAGRAGIPRYRKFAPAKDVEWGGTTFKEWMAQSESLLPPTEPKLALERRLMIKSWAGEFGIPEELVVYSPRRTGAPGGGMTFPSGEIVMDETAFSGLKFSGAAPEAGAKAIFAHEAGHWYLKDPVRFHGGGGTRVEVRASLLGKKLTLDPEVKRLLRQDIAARKAGTRN